MLNRECVLLFNDSGFLTIFNFFVKIFCFNFALSFEVMKNKEV